MLMRYIYNTHTLGMILKEHSTPTTNWPDESHLKRH